MRRELLVVVCACTIAFEACGGSSPTSPSNNRPVLTERVTSAHYEYRFSPGDTVDTAWQEAYHQWAVTQLGVSPPIIHYNKYTSRTHMGEVTGRDNTNGYAETSTATIHTIWPIDNHEVVHVMAGPWGSPSALFGEGFAVAHQMNPFAGDYVAKWSGVPVHDRARGFRAQGQLPSIINLAVTTDFRSRDPNMTYPVAGSFVRYLIDSHGIGSMRTLYGRMAGDAPIGTVRTAFQQVYGFSLDEAETRWLAFLDASRL